MPFARGVRAYMQQHQYQNTVTSDLWSALERLLANRCGRSLRLHHATGRAAHRTSLRHPVSMAPRRWTVQQSRFGLDEASKQPLQWTVPVVARVTGQATSRFEVKGATPQTLTLTGCGPVELNAGQTGYYRVRYAPAGLRSWPTTSVNWPVSTNWGC